MAIEIIHPEDEMDGGAELESLRNQVVAQARELATLRWEMSVLARKHPISGQATRVKSSLLKRFPRQAARILQLRRILPRLAKAKPQPVQARRGAEVIAFGGLSLAGPVLSIGDTSVARRLKGEIAGAELVTVTGGAGVGRSLPVAPANEPTLRPPEEGSFVKALIDDPNMLRQFGTIVVDAADDLSLGVLRGRLSSGQTLVLDVMTPASPASPLASELGDPQARESSLRSYSNFPAAWLDPIDRSGRPVVSLVSQLDWPKISVVMVSFNQAAFLEEGLKSVLDQGYPNLEFIVVDGNSTDGSRDILERYRDRVDHLVIEPDKGQSDGLNKGFARATGDILTWVNSDDLLEPGALFRVAQAFTFSGVDIVAGGCRQIGLSRNTIIVDHHNRLPFGIQVPLPLGLLLEMDRFWLTGSFFYQPEVFFSRDIWKRSGGKLRTDLYYVLDYDLWVRMAAAGANVIHIPDFLACSRTHEQQKTTVGMPNMPEIKRLLQEYSSRLRDPP
ncbi:glycosyltransferase family 2 protein [Bradyrhizobium sp. BR 10261]|uniref:glycosyltransferase family 2 protein n=1 Tax=Bradyrhizobium sp. BR 10261 TaxID=2749992 RepID=UPI001C649F49|nr:glycosyltransferase family 2 protein [Bradyrhizobium sp. BR 10261]MBW7961137.1 glycosyltransferase [Bradyrhizobium sp. BR 10261]